MAELTPLRVHPERYEVTHFLERVRQNSRLSRAELRLLRYVVEESLEGRSGELSQKTIAADVFERDLARFDPKADSIVRTTVANLRTGLMVYYSTVGQADALLIELPKGSYVPQFSYRERLSPTSNSHLWSARVALESRTTSGFQTAIRNLDRVLQEAPRLSIALALKAEALCSSAAHGSPPRAALEEGRRLAERALESAEPAWQAWVAMGAVHAALEWNWTAAEVAFQMALERSGNESSTHAWYTAYLVAQGRSREAVMCLQRAVNDYGYLNPTHLADLGMIQILAGDLNGAEVTIAGAVEAAPGYYQHHMNKAILLEAKGDRGGAVRALDEAPLNLMERPVTWGLRAMFAGMGGQVAVARRRMLWIRALRRGGQHVPSSQLAACALGMGDIRQGVRYLVDGAEERDPLAMWFHVYPFFRHLHGDEEFRGLVAQMGLRRALPPQAWNKAPGGVSVGSVG